MKAAAFIALSAAILLCGCTITPQAEQDNGKPVAREYEDESSAAPVIEPVSVERDYTEPEYGQPLVYEDFCIDDYDFLEQRLNEEQNYFAYTYWASYDEDGEIYRTINFLSRLDYGDGMDEVLEKYGAQALIYDPDEDNMLLWARLSDDKKYEQNAMQSAFYCDLIYPLPGLSEPFGQYAGQRFYFDKYGDTIMAVMFINEDVMPLIQIDWHMFEQRDEGFTFELPDPEGKTLIPRVMLNGMASYEKLHTDMAYPCLRFEDGMVTVNWYDSDGNSVGGEGVLKDGVKLSYTMTDNGIDFDLPEGGDSMMTYISYNSYLGAYELHDPYWRDNFDCTLLLGSSVRQEVGSR